MTLRFALAPTCEAVIAHAGSGTTGPESASSIYHGTRNRIWTYDRNMPASLLVLTLPGHLALTLCILARSLFTPRLRPTPHGLAYGIKGIAQMRPQGPWTPAERRSSLGRLLSRMAWNPWRNSQRKTHIPPLRG